MISTSDKFLILKVFFKKFTLKPACALTYFILYFDDKLITFLKWSILRFSIFLSEDARLMINGFSGTGK